MYAPLSQHQAPEPQQASTSHQTPTPQRTPSPTTTYASSNSQLNSDGLDVPPATTVIDPRPPLNNTPALPPLDYEKAETTPPGWPTSPKRIKTPIYVNVLNSFFDVLLLACSTAFLVFALVVCFHDQAPTAQYPRLTQTLLNATKYGPTVFPILFASVVGRAAHAILLWRLAKGERIGVLDTLASSTSLTSTVTSQLQLRTLSILGVVLTTVWSLSPIGGQATVRLITIGPKDTTVPQSFKYMVNSGTLGSFDSETSTIEGQQSTSVLFVAALAASAAIKSSPLDLWGNVKIPRIESYEGTNTMDEEGWYDTKSGDINAFSSLIGIPITGINSVNGSNYMEFKTRIQTPYLSTKCSLNITKRNLQFSEKKMPGISSNCSGSGSTIYWNEPDNGERHHTLPEEILPLKMKYSPNFDSNFTFECNVTSTYVETEIACPTATNCAATRVRRSQLDHFPPAWTQLDLSWRNLKLVLGGMCKDNGKFRIPQLLDRYMVDPHMLYVNANSSEYLPRTSEENYEIRFGQMLNSYFSIMNGIGAITAGLNDDTAYFWDSDQTFTLKNPVKGWDELFHNTSRYTWRTKTWPSDGTKVERAEVMYAHLGWVIALCIASSVLIASSLIHPLVHYFFSTGVDVAMNISSLATRNNSYLPLPSTGTYLEASDRARLLSNTKIRFGDANDSEEIGSLAIGAFNMVDSTGIAQVRKGRVYE